MATCNDFTCWDVPSEVMVKIFITSVPFVITLIISLFILRYSKYKFNRIQSWLSTCNCWHEDHCSECCNETCFLNFEPVIRYLIIFTCFLPIFLLIGWTIISTVLLIPYFSSVRIPVTVGMIFLLGGTSIVVTIYLLLHWSSENYRLTALHTRLAYFLFFCFTALIMIFTFVALSDFYTLYLAFMTLNTIFFSIFNFLSNFRGSHPDFSAFLKLQTRPDSLIVKSKEAVERIKKYRKYLFALGWILLIVLAIVAKLVYHNTSGLRAMITIMITDMVILAQSDAGVITSVIGTNFLSIFARLSIFAFGNDNFVLSLSLIFTIFVLLTGYNYIQQKYPIFTFEEALDQSIGEIQSRLDQNDYENVANAPMNPLRSSIDHKYDAKEIDNKDINLILDQHVPNHSKKALDTIQGIFTGEYAHALGLGGSLFLLCLAFFLYLILAIVSHFENNMVDEFPPSNVFNMLSRSHPAYHFLLVALFFTLWFIMACYCYRIYLLQLQKNRHNSNLSAIFSVQFIITLVLFLLMGICTGIFLWFVTSSYIVLVHGLFLPPIIVLCVFIYIQWSANDYSFIIKKTDEPPLYCGLSSNQFYLLVRLSVGIGLCLIFIIFAGFTLSYFLPHYGWIFSTVLGEVIVLSFIYIAWFRTFKLPYIALVFLLFLVIMLGVELVYFDIVSSTYAVSITMAPIFFYSFFMTFLTWKQNWQFSRNTKIFFLFTFSLSIVWLVLLNLSINNTMIWVSSWLLWSLFWFYSTIVVIWSNHGFHLPNVYRYTTSIISLIIVISVLIGLVVLDINKFVTFSVLWYLIILLLIIYSLQNLLIGSDSFLISSSTIFPLYIFHPRTGLQSHNKGLITTFIVCFLLTLWGFAASMTLSDSFWGWLVVLIALNILCNMALKYKLNTASEFWKAWEVIENNPSLLEEIKKNSINQQFLNIKDMTEDDNTVDDDINPEVKNYLHQIRQYWKWQENNRFSELEKQRKMFEKMLSNRLKKTIVVSENPPPINLSSQDQSQKIPQEMIENNLLDVATTLFKIDEQIRTTYSQKNQLVANFIFLVISSSETIRLKRQSYIKDFIQMLKRCAETDHADLSTKNIDEIKEWVRTNQDTLDKCKEQYLNSVKENQKNSEETSLNEKIKSKQRREKLQQKISQDDDKENKLSQLMIETDDPESLAQSIKTPLKSQVDSLLELKQEYYDEQFDTIVSPSSNVESDSKSRSAPISLDFSSLRWKKPSSEITVVIDEKSHSLNNVIHQSNESKDVQTTYNPEHIMQGDLEDCYFLSALSIVAHHQPEHFERLFLVNTNSEKAGLFGMQFYAGGRWRSIFIDNRFPVKEGDILAFAKSKALDLWVSIAEKCYAKLYGGYPMIGDGGLVSEALVDLTGGASEMIAIKETDLDLYNGRTWDKLKRYFNQQYLMGAGSNTNKSIEENRGIVPGHAYAVYDVKEYDDVRLIQLRNPWGQGEWTGDYSDDSPLWTNRLKKLFGLSTENDGKFWMTFEDFIIYFRTIYICRVFVSSNWNCLIQENSWCPEKQTDQGCPNPKKEKNIQVEIGDMALNPHFYLQINKPSEIFIRLKQVPRQPQQYVKMAFFILSNNGKRVTKNIKGSECVAKTGFRTIREASLAVTLEPEVVYTIFACTYRKGEIADFQLSVFALDDISVTFKKLDDVDGGVIKQKQSQKYNTLAESKR